MRQPLRMLFPFVGEHFSFCAHLLRISENPILPHSFFLLFFSESHALLRGPLSWG